MNKFVTPGVDAPLSFEEFCRDKDGQNLSVRVLEMMYEVATDVTVASSIDLHDKQARRKRNDRSKGAASFVDRVMGNTDRWSGTVRPIKEDDHPRRKMSRRETSTNIHPSEFCDEK